MHDFVAKLALRSKMLGSIWYVICPCPSRTITGSASKAKKAPNFIKPKFPKKAPKISKKLYFWNHQDVSFRVVGHRRLVRNWQTLFVRIVFFYCRYASLVLSPPTPSNKLYDAGDCLQFVCALLQNRPEVFSMGNWPLGSSQIKHLAPRNGAKSSFHGGTPLARRRLLGQWLCHSLHNSDLFVRYSVLSTRNVALSLWFFFTFLWRCSLEQIWRPHSPWGAISNHRGRCLISDPLSLKRHSSESSRPTSFLFDFYERSNIFLRKSTSALCKSPPIWL